MENVKIKYRKLFFLTVVEKNRNEAGIPQWEKVDRWLDETVLPDYPEEIEKQPYVKKNPEVKTLENYREDPGEEFWEKFPKTELPKKAQTKINVEKLEEYITKIEGKITVTELRRAKKVLGDLRNGASAYQMKELPPVKAKNAESSFENGEMLTDQVAYMVKKGYVAGPFKHPPLAGFRENPLAAVIRNGKARPVLNMSGPVGKSFNDNVDKTKLEKIRMATAKSFSYGLRRAGKNAIFSKFDMRDAYKLVPARPEDFKLQGLNGWKDTLWRPRKHLEGLHQ